MSASEPRLHEPETGLDRPRTRDVSPVAAIVFLPSPTPYPVSSSRRENGERKLRAEAASELMRACAPPLTALPKELATAEGRGARRPCLLGEYHELSLNSYAAQPMQKTTTSSGSPSKQPLRIELT
jgi:hypothetical protein